MSIRLPLRRRAFLKLAAALPLPFLLPACGDSDAPLVPASGASEPEPTNTAASAATRATATTATSPSASAASPQATQATATTLAATPACGDDDDDDLTLAQTEGPYYTPNTPERQLLREAGMKGTPLMVRGFVLSTGCKPIAKALIDFWQCDDAGVYDNSGFTLRGHQFTAADGGYKLETILPAVYPGRTRHIHVKVQAPGKPVLTTQLYFPDEPANARDGIFRPELVMKIAAKGTAQEGRFDFVLNVA